MNLVIEYFMIYYFWFFLEVIVNIFMLFFIFIEVFICESLFSILGINLVVCCMNMCVWEMVFNKGILEDVVIRDFVDILRKY